MILAPTPPLPPLLGVERAPLLGVAREPQAVLGVALLEPGVLPVLLPAHS